VGRKAKAKAKAKARKSKAAGMGEIKLERGHSFFGLQANPSSDQQIVEA
jgi:hypothetical protein